MSAPEIVDAIAKAMCNVETRSKAASLEEVQAGIQRWTRHRYEAERLIEELTDGGVHVALSTPPADDVREALVRLIADARAEDDLELGETIGDRPLADTILAAFSVDWATEPTTEEWAEQMDAERARQVERGYDDAHDAKHGVAHLLNWAVEYGRRGNAVAAATMTRCALRMLSTPPANDVREATAVKRWCSYFGCRVVVYEGDDYFGQGCPVCGHVGEVGEVRPRGTATDAEVEAALFAYTRRMTGSMREQMRAALEAAQEVRS